MKATRRPQKIVMTHARGKHLCFFTVNNQIVAVGVAAGVTARPRVIRMEHAQER